MTKFKGVVTVAVLNPELDRVITGYCDKTNTRKLLNDITSVRECAGDDDTLKSDASESARRLLRIHFRISEHDIASFSLINVYVPNVDPRRTTGNYAVQYFFLAILHQRARPCLTPNRACGLIDLHFVDVLTALASWQLNPGERKVIGGSRAWSGGNRNRMNPHHALNLARSLVILRDCIGSDPSGKSFQELLARVGDYGIENLDRCIDEINGAMRERRV